jgi:hypothetical protein
MKSDQPRVSQNGPEKTPPKSSASTCPETMMRITPVCRERDVRDCDETLGVGDDGRISRPVGEHLPDGGDDDVAEEDDDAEDV